MRKTLLGMALGAVLFLGGCGDLLSLYPLDAGPDRVIDRTLEGRWENDDNLLTVAREGDTYGVTLRSKTTPAEVQEYEMHLVDVAGVRMADIVPTGGVLGHMFLKVRVAAGELRFAFFDSKWLRDRIPHEDAPVAKGNRQAVLVAPTAELRKQVEKYAAIPEAYDDEIVYRREANAVQVVPDGGTGETTYSIAQGTCTVRWIVNNSGINRSVIRHRADCSLPLAAQIPLIARVMSRVFADAPGGTFRTLYWGRLSPDGQQDHTLSMRLAAAAGKSPQWDAVRGLPRSGNLNLFVRKIANEALIYAELRDTFRKAGLDIEVGSVEKVLVGRAAELPFLEQPVKAGDRLPYDCMTWFSISPSHL